MGPILPSHVLLVIFAAAAVTVDAQNIVVGFEQTSYAIAEGGMSEICVVIISPDDIETTQVYLEVIPINNTNGVGNEATQDTVDELFGDHNMAPGADYRQPLSSGSLQIFDTPFTQSMRRVCYDQLTYQDMEPEGNEFFTLQVRRDPNNPSRTPANVVIDDVLGTALVTIVDDDGVPAAMCGNLSDPENGTVTVMGTAPGSMATYECDSGFQLEESVVLTCGDDGEWSPAPPDCQRITYVIGFENTSYTVAEGESVEVCVIVRDPPDIGGVQLFVQVENNANTSVLPADAGVATPDTIVPIFGDHNMAPGADYRQPLGSGSFQIYNRPLNQTMRRVCYDQLTYQDTEPEESEFFSITLVTEARSLPNIVLNPDTIVVEIVDDDEDVPVCPDLSHPDNGEVEIGGTLSEDEAKYFCTFGYILVGDETRICSNGIWSGVPPVCREIRCPVLPSIANGVILMLDNTLDSIAEFTCDVGYELVGSPLLTCLETEIWDLPAPNCQQRIIAVEFSLAVYSVIEGVDLSVKLMLVRSEDTADLQANVTITVLPGTAINGEDYDTTPTLNVFFNFGELEKTVNVDIIDDNYIEDPENFAVVIFESIPITGNRADITIDDDDRCPDQFNIDNGEVTISGFATGDTASYVCVVFNHALVGDPTRVCQRNSTWTGEVPSCVAVCDAIFSIDNGDVEITGTLPGDQTIYTCHAGFRLVGNPILVCQGGSFIGPPPICVPVTAERVNDTVIGDPLFTVHLAGGQEVMCYEVRGEPGLYLNLVSDSCTSVNAHYDNVPSNPNLNRMRTIGIKSAVSADANEGCVQVEINVDGCTANIDGLAVNGMLEVGDVRVRRFGGNRWRVRVSNCDELSAVMWVTCSGEMLRFRIARGSSLSINSHGLLGQFWGIPVNVGTEEDQYIEVHNIDSETYRRFPYVVHDITWNHDKTTCYYVGNKQGGPENSHDPIESVIEGDYSMYSTGGLFDTGFVFSRFDDDTCVVSS